ncbi:hypothetical protein B0A52_08572 [Exophiala mesophila]|uniref:FAD/NAD(P)-binding domain-containing protein n=1 Tax=Exophiala mesophila TaxID=212818 RepID=A0A438MW45_EXOME|nr:hypothetical protein B0A52_08572 [Exophiala mesophila]
MANSRKYIVVIGGSYGGVSVAHYLLKHALPQLPATESYQLVMVSTASKILCRPACPRALISDAMFNQDKLFVDIVEVFKQYPDNSFRFVQGTAIKLDHTERRLLIQLADGVEESINFHALVIATGASTPSPLLGLHGSEDSLKASWRTFRQSLPNAKSIVVGGGGPAGVETAGELGEFLNGRAGWFSSALNNPKVAITLITAGPRILPVLRAHLADEAEKYLSKVGVTVIKNTRIESISPMGAGTDNVSSNAELTLQGGGTIKADLYIPATGTRPNTSFIDKSLLAADGRVVTNASTLRVNQAGERIYAIGDAGSYSRPAVHMILDAVPVLCANVKADLLRASSQTGNTAVNIQDRTFKEDTRESQLVPIGKTKGVGAMMGYRLPSFLVWLVKGRDYWLWTTSRLWSGKQWSSES